MSDVNRAFTVNIYAAISLFHSAKNQRAVLFGFNVDCALNIGINNRAAVLNAQAVNLAVFIYSTNTTAGRFKVNGITGINVTDVVSSAYNIAVSGNIYFSTSNTAQRKVYVITGCLLQSYIACCVGTDEAAFIQRYLHSL